MTSNTIWPQTEGSDTGNDRPKSFVQCCRTFNALFNGTFVCYMSQMQKIFEAMNRKNGRKTEKM